MVYLYYLFIEHLYWLLRILLYIFTSEMYFPIHPLVDAFNTFTRGCIFLLKIFFTLLAPLELLHSKNFQKKYIH